MRQLIGLAVLPSIVLLYYIYKQDKVEKEPFGLLLKIFIFGCISVIPTIFAELFFEAGVLQSLFYKGTLTYVLVENFVGVALIEEIFKYLAARLGAWKSPHFNYTFDAIVYCVVAALGFATIENIQYCLSYGFETAIIRAVLSVPSHAIDGIIMGNFFAQAKVAQWNGEKGRCRALSFMAILMPTLAHGFYDSALSLNSGIVTLAFFIFIFVIYIWAYKFVKKQSKYDEMI